MASFAGMFDTYGPNPASWQQYPLQLQGDDLRTQTALNASRENRDFSQYNLPDLINNFASKGSYYSGTRQRDVNRLGTQVAEGVGDQARNAGMSLSDLATRGVGINTGGGF